MKSGISSEAMTLISAAMAVIAFVSVNLPENVPWWVKISLGALLSGGNVLMGYSHPGTGTRQSLPVHMQVEEGKNS